MQILMTTLNSVEKSLEYVRHFKENFSVKQLLLLGQNSKFFGALRTSKFKQRNYNFVKNERNLSFKRGF